MNVPDYDPGAYSIFRKGVFKGKNKYIGWMEFLTFCFAWNEV